LENTICQKYLKYKETLPVIKPISRKKEYLGQYLLGPNVSALWVVQRSLPD
jgi:hypothetical protein